MSLLGLGTEVLSINKHWSVGSRWMDEFILAASKGVWDPHNNSALKGHLRSRKSFGWRHTSLFFSYRSVSLPFWFLSNAGVKQQGKRGRGPLPGSLRGHFATWMSLSCVMPLKAVLFLPPAPPPKPNKYGEFGRKFPLSHACVGPHRGHRLTEQEYGSSYT